MSTPVRAALGVVVVAVAVVLLIVLRDDGDDSSGETTTTTATTAPATTKPAPAAPESSEPVTTIEIDESGRPVGGVAEIAVDEGEEIRFAVSSPVADEVHVHGYDVEKAVPAGGTAVLSFPADIEGLFEVELHHSEEQIAELRVNP